ncbi:3-hydroxyacyl-ACP dehydratase FabZ family protein [Thalassoglobus sp. JC818]|uniref:3-hydroxyacyl-ACP dehydratase FabZ family protein n=1 Tax=Thalassoglobus sp. JC818 TaxID=3232136 RepID=UPI00345964FD
MRFSLIDRITGLERDESITAIKNLTLAEEYLQDHFPGFPVMPGVLLVESLVQSCGWLMRYSCDFAYSTVLLEEAKAVKFNKFLAPGNSMTIDCRVQKKDDDGTRWTFKAAGSVDDTNIVSAKLTLTQFNLADQYPKIASGDELQTQHAKELFATLGGEELTKASSV